MPDQERVNIEIRRIDEEIWIEFYQPGLRVRFELNQQEIDDLHTISGQMARDLRQHIATKEAE